MQPPTVRSLQKDGWAATLPYSFCALHSQQSGSTSILCGLRSPHLALSQLWCVFLFALAPNTLPQATAKCLRHMLLLASQSTSLLTFAVSRHLSSSFASECLRNYTQELRMSKPTSHPLPLSPSGVLVDCWLLRIATLFTNSAAGTDWRHFTVKMISKAS